MNGNKELMQEWFKKADHDRLNAEIILESGREPLPLDTVCFHCQQAVEKYLKGFLVYHEVQFSRTHFLGTLLEQCKQIDETFEELDNIIELNIYAVDIRYPDDSMEITLNDAQQAHKMANEVKSFVTEKASGLVAFYKPEEDGESSSADETEFLSGVKG